jgi:DNA-binding XRE family transcriptional regulator
VDAGSREENASKQKADAPKQSFLLLPGNISQPVEAARALKGLGLSLRKAHDTLNRLVRKEIVAVSLQTQRPDAAVTLLNGLGIVAAPIVPPKVDVKQIRDEFQLSQSEFATRFGLELDSLKNWEQHRYQPDAMSRLLLKIIESHPNVVEAVLTATAIPANEEPKDFGHDRGKDPNAKAVGRGRS